MEQKELDEIIRRHHRWLNREEGGTRADLSNAYLRGASLPCAKLRNADLSNADLSNADLINAYLQSANLQSANLRGANLRGADLTVADLRGAYLQSADLQGAGLREADLRGADLRGADLQGADLRGTDLQGADLSNADLRGADLRGADLRGADVDNVRYDSLIAGFTLQCPAEGAFTAFKKVYSCKKYYIAKLIVPADARRSSATSRKCRCDKAEVSAILLPDGSDSGLSEIQDSAYNGLTYKVGEMAFADSWEEDRWAECSHGIHFFITFEEAVNY